MTVVEVFADVCCPFTHVGLRRVVQRRAQIGADLRLVVRAWPLELVNGAPLDGELIGEEVDELRASVAADLFAGFDRTAFPASSLPALAFAAAAYAHDVTAGERASLMLRDALFEQGRDIARPEEIARIATEIGLPQPLAAGDQVVADWNEGRQRGVVGSPHFFVGEASFFCPMLDIQRIDERLHISADPGGFDDFIERCLAS